MSDLSIVTVGYESSAKLPSFLCAARRAAPEAELIVVDNASRDDTSGAARQHGADRVIANAANMGFARACNAGARSATSEWLLFANPDVTLEQVPRCELLPRKGYGLGAGMVREDEVAHRPAVRAETCLLEDVLAQVLTRFLPTPVSQRLPKRRRPARWAGGAALLCRRSEYLALGGFDERFFMYFEDRDLAKRYTRAGYGIKIEPTLRGAHGHGESSPRVASWVRERWSLASWIEYRGVWHGPRAAYAAAAIATMTLARMQALGERLPLQRTRRKSESVAMILQGLDLLEEDLPSAPGFYPLALSALREVRGSLPREGTGRG